MTPHDIFEIPYNGLMTLEDDEPETQLLLTFAPMPRTRKQKTINPDELKFAARGCDFDKSTSEKHKQNGEVTDAEHDTLKRRIAVMRDRLGLPEREWDAQ